MSFQPNSEQVQPLPSRAGSTGRWRREWEVAALGVLVVATYFTRLSAVPVCGEESRWAAAAREMIARGDWIVPRQQGTIFPERPPLGSWAMGLLGLARHEVDLVAVRLPSACAILMLTWLIYAYARSWMSRRGSFASAAIFATLGQVLTLGRFGESEAVFTLFIAASLLVWHLGYMRRWPVPLVWSLGYSLAALGALTKGLQAPVYFVAVCGVYLLLVRDWRWLFSRGHALGLACFAAIVGAWLVPFAAADWHAIGDIWLGLVGDRVTTAGLLTHVASFPVETFGCLLPWSPLLLALFKPSVFKSLLRDRPPVRFLLVALAVTYPSVWLAAGAKGRYYMPLYPCLAILMGLVVEHCTARAAILDHRRVWRLFLRGAAIAVSIGAVVIVAASLLPIERLASARQPLSFLVVWAVVAAVSAGVLTWASLGEQAPRPQVAIFTLCGFVGMTYVGAVINSRAGGGNDLAPAVVEIKEQLPEAGQLVSLGRVYHRFAYCYETPIRQIPWPSTAGEVPPDVTYFCFDHRPSDTAESRSTSDGRPSPSTSGTLPFEWEKIAEIPCDAVKRGRNDRTVVIGRVRRTELLAEPTSNRPVRR